MALGIIFIGLGIVFSGFYMFHRIRHYRAIGIVTTGEALYVISPDAYHHRRHSLIIRYTDVRGEEQRAELFEQGVNSRVGDLIQIRYDPHNPKKIRLAAEQPQEVAMPYVVIVLGGCTVLYGIFRLLTL